MTDEQWRPVPGYEGRYEVSDLGRVRSIDRWLAYRDSRRLHRGKVLRPWWDSKDYPCVYLGRGNPHRIHRLVMETFTGPCPKGQQVRHLDGDQTNPALRNLAYGTQSENELDKQSHGTQHNVNKTHCPRNHPYDEANTRIYRGRRYCRACKRGPSAVSRWRAQVGQLAVHDEPLSV